MKYSTFTAWMNLVLSTILTLQVSSLTYGQQLKIVAEFHEENHWMNLLRSVRHGPSSNQC